MSRRRWRACALATVRRSNCTCSFPVYSFHEDSRLRGAIEGINWIKFTSRLATSVNRQRELRRFGMYFDEALSTIRRRLRQ
jgi:hypothetical protein